MSDASESMVAAAASATPFLRAALEYKARLGRTADPGEYRRLWRDTSLPYAMEEADPFSAAYREEVTGIYAGLTGADYDVGAELTSTKQADALFQIGYPWTSGDVGIVAAEMSKAVQAMQVLARMGGRGRVIEFGAGWGNLALPLARAGFAVTAVDIDPAFNARMRRLAAEQHTSLHTFDGSFLQASTGIDTDIDGPFETVIFQSSFHHCLDFDRLLANVTDRLLAADGRILFLSEPVTPELPFPWGIRFDGEALWAVMLNGWLELGFQQDFFIRLLLRHNLFATRVPGLPGLVGDGWCATRAERGVAFASLVLPAAADASFHPADANPAWGRYCRRRSRLPGGGGGTCVLRLENHGPKPLHTECRVDGRTVGALAVPAHGGGTLLVPNGPGGIDIVSDVFVPHDVMGNGDTREIGPALVEVRWSAT